VLAVAEGSKEDKASWTAFLRHLKERGLKGVRLFVSDKCLGLVESLGGVYPEALWQRCAVHLYRKVWTAVPTSKEPSTTRPRPQQMCEKLWTLPLSTTRFE
jgi:putative transposase